MGYTALSTKDKIRFGNDVQTITTLEIAEMMGLPHYEILKKLEGTTNQDGSVRQVGIIPTLGKGKIPVTDYFIKSTYTTSQNKEMPCYKVTKLGCDFLANKFTGEKGILFTARYVKRFNEMERGQVPKDFPSALRAYADEVERRQIAEQENERLQQELDYSKGGCRLSLWQDWRHEISTTGGRMSYRSVYGSRRYCICDRP